jgi:hypothetical protein
MWQWRQRRADEHHDYDDDNNYPFVERGASTSALTST